MLTERRCYITIIIIINVIFYCYYYCIIIIVIIFLNPEHSSSCFKNSRSTKLAEMTISPVDPWENRRAKELC